MEYYPIFLDLKERPCLVVGGGMVALRKTEGLLDCGAKVDLISPVIVSELREAATSKPLRLIERKYQTGDSEGYSLVIAATDDRAVNAGIYEEVRELGIPVNVVDDPPLCGFILPSIIRRGPITVAFSTSGRSPALARRLREYLERAIGPEYGALAELLGELRPLFKQYVPTEEARNEVMDEMLSRGVLKHLRRGQIDQAREVATACICSSSG